MILKREEARQAARVQIPPNPAGVYGTTELAGQALVQARVFNQLGGWITADGFGIPVLSIYDCVGGIGAGVYGGYNYTSNDDIHGGGAGGDENSTCFYNSYPSQWYPCTK